VTAQEDALAIQTPRNEGPPVGDTDLPGPSRDPNVNFREAIRLHSLGRLQDAEPFYRAVLKGAPHQPDCLKNLALILKARGDDEGALGLLRTAVAHNPAFAGAHAAMGPLLARQGRMAEALTALDHAVRLQPNDPDILNNRANVLGQLNRPDEAVASYDRAIALRPGYVSAHVNRALELGIAGRFEEAVAGFRTCLQLDPGNAAALGAKLNNQLQICDWSDYDAAVGLVARGIAQGVNVEQPSGMLVHATAPELQRACTRLHVAARFPTPRPRLWNGEAYRHDRIRLAYISADFRDHAVSYLIAGLLERHDRSRFEVSAYALGPRVEDDRRQQVRAAVDDFHDVAELGDLQVAERIRAAEADVVVDLTGFTKHCRPGILAHRPAPVQINYLGYPGSMGVEFMDYILADGRVIPPGAEPFYREQVIRLPHSYLVNDLVRQAASVPATREAEGLPPDGVVFACFNAIYKLNPAVFDVWMRLLGRLPGSVLWLSRANDAAVRNLRAEAERRGVSGDRLVFAPYAPSQDHMARHRLADLFLDTLPYNAHTTASDALWAGLPIVTCAGTTFPGRVGASLLHAAGLPELITDSLEAYEALAYDLATQPGRLSELKAKILAQRAIAPLFDADLFRRHIEQAYVMVWERSQAGQAPAAFDVAP
jgi:protein O-GlcNAc transferase